ncbi:MAG: hypothetical protein AUK55_10770 [Syntrophobacteraceae bacterium CG2_30_61_12]|nr:MAG: hypothetical protein AUK55_10770 [Syntrophobacteraceae bacterium CG2_30_61_12]
MRLAVNLQQPQSDALKRNMDLTNIPVEVDPAFQVLEDAVADFAGKRRQAAELLREYHHRYRNWRFVVQETWRYATGNFPLLAQHPLNGRIMVLLTRILLDAVENSAHAEVRRLAADHLLAFWLRIAEEKPELAAAPAPAGFAADRPLPPDDLQACHEGLVRATLHELSRLPAEAFQYLLRSLYQPRKLAAELLRIWTRPQAFSEMRALLTRLVEETYRFWLDQADPCRWLADQAGIAMTAAGWRPDCEILGHDHHQRQLLELDRIRSEADPRVAVQRLITIPSFHDLVISYRRLPEQLKAHRNDPHAAELGLLMRLKIIETKGLESIHEEVLREINFDLARWIQEEAHQDLRERLGALFEVLAKSLESYPEAALQCVRTIGLEILDTDNSELIEYFIARVIRIGFQTPNLGGVSDQWQVLVNPSHLTNTRIWLELVKRKPKRTKSLLAALIVNLSLGGICIRDTDLFQKDVSELLHSPIKPIYNLVKQLAKLFPIYFNQIGAEGQLRSVSTDLDELTNRRDGLIHFLRKQSHVESNNLIVYFCEEIIRFWHTLDKRPLENFVPPEVYRDIACSGPLVDDIHRIFKDLFQSKTIHHPRDLLDLNEETARKRLQEVAGVQPVELERAVLMIRFYQLLHEKYALSFKDIRVHLERAAQLGLADPEKLLKALENGDQFGKLREILNYLDDLKAIILGPGQLHTIENIYHKRHIAVDIPSMYGSYNERKFDALGLTFRLENLANVLFEEIILSFNLRFITRATFFRISRFLPLFIKALSIDGITSRRLERQEELFQKAIEIRRFSHSQYIDIFRGFSEAIKQIIQSYYNSVHEDNLELIIDQLGLERLLPRYRRHTAGETKSQREQRISESFLRDLVARTFGLQYFDHFLSSILTTLAAQKQELSVEKLDLLLSYDTEKTISLIHRPNPRTCDLIHLGNKGYNLTQLHSIGIQVPVGFVITTEYYRCRDVIDSFSQSGEDFEERVLLNVRKLETATGRCFGGAEKSLLLSVRSGSAVSMPGMMNTFLNVGINEAVVLGLIEQTGQAWFAWDNYRRFLQSWGMSSGLERNIFDAIMAGHKKIFGCKVKREFKPEEIRQVALAYKQALRDHGVDFSDDPRDQLFTAVRQVMQSWFYPKAVTYRSIMGLSENWGTAVTIQAMIFGNLDTQSGAGVMFTHNPQTSEDEIEVSGDFTLGNQGEDVVGGLVKTLPLTEKQRLRQREPKESSLESMFPNVYQRLEMVAAELIYRQNWGPQEIEFTFQGDRAEDLYILQSRNMAPRVKRDYPVFIPGPELDAAYLSSGVGVSGGALCGRVAFDLDAIVRLRKSHPRQAIILIRSDTVPDDIHEISIADGILTGKGGATSHAAIVAHRLGKTCVVGCGSLRVWEADRHCQINGTGLETGDMIGIDGQSGAIFMGRHEIHQLERLNQQLIH